MTDTEQKALALVNEANGGPYRRYVLFDRSASAITEALCRSIEAHEATKAEFEAFRREVSDAVEEMLSEHTSPHKMKRFILPKPVDPLVEVLTEVLGKPMPGCERAAQTRAEALRTALHKRGLEVRAVGEG